MPTQPSEPVISKASHLWASGHSEAAIELLRSLGDAFATSADAQHLLGLALMDIGQVEQALPHLFEAARLTPSDTELLYNLGSALSVFGDDEKASQYFREALSIDPDNANCLLAFGESCCRQQNWTQAVHSLEKLTHLTPSDHRVWNAMARTQLGMGRLEESIGSLVRSLEHSPENETPPILRTLGMVLSDLYRYDEAAQAFSQLLSLYPEDNYALVQLIHCKQQVFDWEGLEQLFSTCRRKLDTLQDGNFSGDPFPLLAIPGLNGEHLYKAAAQFSNYLFPLSNENPLRISDAPSLPLPRKIKVGYLSFDFRDHPVAHLVTDILINHDRQKFEIFAYSYGPDDGSDVRYRLKSSPTNFTDLAGQDDEAAAATIQKDGVEILVDLTGWTGATRPGILFRHPAKFQVSWLGYPGTLGDRRLVQYFLTDSFSIPESESTNFAETLLRLPCSFIPLPPFPLLNGNSSRKSQGLPAGAKVIYCPSQAYKITPDIFNIWCQILAAHPDTILWMSIHNPSARDALKREVQKRGLQDNRLVFCSPVPSREEHIARLELADLALDTYPYGSHSSAVDVISAGVPIVTLCGSTLQSRVCGSLLHHLGLGELITHDKASYLQCASSLLQAPNTLSAVRLQVRAAVSSHKVATLTRAMETIFQELVEGLTPNRQQST